MEGLFVFILIAVLVLVAVLAVYGVWKSTGYSRMLDEAIREAPDVLAEYLRENPPELRYKKIMTNGGKSSLTYGYVDDDVSIEVEKRVRMMVEKLSFPDNYAVYYFAIPLDKTFTMGTQTRSNINSGITVVGRGRAASYIYRREEAPRVTIHEMFHASHPPCDDVGFYRGLNLKEAIVDALATMIEMEATGGSLDDAIARSKLQVNRILKIYNMSFSELLHTNQPTNLREYYLVKYLVLVWLARKYGTSDNFLQACTDREQIRRDIVCLIDRNNFIQTDVPLGDMSASRY